MQYVHPLALAELLNDNMSDVPPVPRPALAGGSDHRPPEDDPPSAQIIRFPVERVRRRDTPDQTGNTDGRLKLPAEERSELDANAAALWPSWMLRTLAGCYRAPTPPGGPQMGLTA